MDIAETLDQIELEIHAARKWEHYFEPAAVLLTSVEWAHAARASWPEEPISAPGGERRYQGLLVFLVSAPPAKRVLLAEKVLP